MICREKYGTRRKSGKALSIEEKVAFVRDTVSGQGNMDACFVLNYGFEEQLPWPQVRKLEHKLKAWLCLKNSYILGVKGKGIYWDLVGTFTGGCV